MRHRLSSPVLILCLSTAASAQDATTGATLFVDHCAACHGMGANGDGPIAEVLSVQPSDLTGLSAANGGVFPLERVVRQIDGRDSVVSHGGPMPVYGNLLAGDSGVIDAADGTPVFTPQPVVDLAAWLLSIQD